MLLELLLIRPTRYRVLIGGVCALILTMGIARYAFTPMIPVMQNQIDMSESLAGWLAGWAYMGYLTGLFIVWLVNDLRLKDYLYRYGLFLGVFATSIMAMHEHTLVWYIGRFFSGIATAFGFILGTGLVHQWFMSNGKKEELGLHFSGMGLGIVISAIVVALTEQNGILGVSWRYQWVVLSMVGFLFLIPAFLLIPVPGSQELKAAKEKDSSEEPSFVWLWLLQIAYICAGFSNTVNITFTSLMAEYQPLEGQGTLMWLYVGLAAAPAPFIWDRVARKMGYLDALRVAFIVHIVSNLLIVMYHSYAATLLSSLFFGFAFMGIVSLTLSVVGVYYRYRATQVMARLTLGYCIAQILSPVAAGMVTEVTGSFLLPLYVISAIMVIGLICLLAMKRSPAR
jgi:predicted MFS family arabinose efflux permease